MYLILSVLAIFAVLVFSEFGWRKHWLRGEFGRKFVHITVGSFVAFWPFFLSWTEIRLLSLAFLGVVLLSNYFRIFHAIHSVQRPTFGEVCFALTVGGLTFITHEPAIYAAALLQMSLADGVAAVVGTKFGVSNKYHLFGHIKSIAGTTAFVVVSLAILIGYSIGTGTYVPAGVMAFGAFGAALLENVSPLGLDNIVVPVFVGLLLVSL